MLRTLQVKTKVLPGHRIEICSPELPEGHSATVLVTLDDKPAALDTQPHPDFQAAEQRFRQDLPELLRAKPGRWVVYTSTGCIAEGDDPMTLHRHCYQQGLPRGRFLVARVEPDLPTAEITDNWFPPPA